MLLIKKTIFDILAYRNLWFILQKICLESGLDQNLSSLFFIAAASVVIFVLGILVAYATVRGGLVDVFRKLTVKVLVMKFETCVKLLK